MIRRVARHSTASLSWASPESSSGFAARPFLKRRSLDASNRLNPNQLTLIMATQCARWKSFDFEISWLCAAIGLSDAQLMSYFEVTLKSLWSYFWSHLLRTSKLKARNISLEANAKSSTNFVTFENLISDCANLFEGFFCCYSYSNLIRMNNVHWTFIQRSSIGF